MNSDDILRMAREAGFDFYETMHVWTTPTESAPYPEGVYTENLERFAALVAAAEREACAKVCDALHDKIELVEKTKHYPGEYGSEYDAGQGNAISECVNAIRARGEK